MSPEKVSKRQQRREQIAASTATPAIDPHRPGGIGCSSCGFCTRLSECEIGG